MMALRWCIYCKDDTEQRWIEMADRADWQRTRVRFCLSCGREVGRRGSLHPKWGLSV